MTTWKGYRRDAIRLCHALANWVGQYEGDKDKMSAIDNNMFDYKEEFDEL